MIQGRFPDPKMGTSFAQKMNPQTRPPALLPPQSPPPHGLDIARRTCALLRFTVPVQASSGGGQVEFRWRSGGVQVGQESSGGDQVGHRRVHVEFRWDTDKFRWSSGGTRKFRWSSGGAPKSSCGVQVRHPKSSCGVQVGVQVEFRWDTEKCEMCCSGGIQAG